MPKYNKTYYKQYITGNQTPKLLELLSQQLDEYLANHKSVKLQDAHDSLILLMSELKSIQEEEDLGIVDFSSTKTSKARIKRTVLKIINSLPSDYFDFLNGVKKEKVDVKREELEDGEVVFFDTKEKKIGAGLLALIILIVERCTQ